MRWRKRLKTPPRAYLVPLSSLQIDALGVLAKARDPESYVAGSTPLNLGSARYSADIDIFHDRADRIAAQAEADAQLLQQSGFTVRWVRQLAFMHTAVIAKGDAETKLEWVGDSDFRFFPTVPDVLFGYRLHPADLAINKIFAAAGRSEPRDVFDLMVIEKSVAPLSALIWAAVEKSPGFTPEGLIAEIRRNLNHPLSAWQSVASATPIDPGDVTHSVRAALDAADDFAARMPSAELGVLFLNNRGHVATPEPDRLDDYTRHRGRQRGHWPTSPEIAAAMMDHFSAVHGRHDVD